MILTFILGGVFGLIGLVATDGVPTIQWIFSSDNLLNTKKVISLDSSTATYLNICLNGIY